MLLSELTQGFLLDCQARNLSQTTVTRAYGIPLRRLCEFLDNPEITAITTNDLRSFIIHSQQRDKFAGGNHAFAKEQPGKKLSPHTIHRYVRVIKTLFNWAANEGLLTDNPAQNIKYPKLPKGQRRNFTNEQIQTLLKEAKRVSFRDYAICFFLLDSGLRSSELCDLTVNDVNVINGLITVRHGKGDKFRQLNIGNNARKILWQYCTQYRKPAHPDIDYFFLNTRGQKLTTNALSLMMRKLAKKCGFRIYVHRFRHTFGTNLARIVPNAFMISQVMGHEDLTTSKQYIHLANSDIRIKSPMDDLLS